MANGENGCADISLSGVAYSYETQSVAFKVVAVGLRAVMTGYGTMVVQVFSDVGGGQEQTYEVNASSFAGARTATIEAFAPTIGSGPLVSVGVYQDGVELCYNTFRLDGNELAVGVPGYHAA